MNRKHALYAFLIAAVTLTAADSLFAKKKRKPAPTPTPAAASTQQKPQTERTATFTVGDQTNTNLQGTLGKITVDANFVVNGKKAIRVGLNDIQISGMKGKPFYMGINIRQDNKWLKGMWVASSIFTPGYDPAAYNGEVVWFTYTYEAIEAQSDITKPYEIWAYVIDKANMDNSFERPVNITFGSASVNTSTAAQPPVAAPSGSYTSNHATNKKKSRLERLKSYSSILSQLGAVGQLKVNINPPADPVQRQKFTAAKSTMESKETKVHASVKSTVADKQQTAAKTKLDASGQTQAQQAETQAKQKGEAEQQAAEQSKEKIDTQTAPKAQEAQAKVDTEGKKGEAEVEAEAAKQEAEVEKAQQGGKNQSEMSGICGACQRAIDAADKKARELVDQGVDAAKSEIKKHIEAAAERLKKETTGRLDAKAAELKAGIKTRVEGEAEKLSTEAGAVIETNVKTQVASAVAAVPADQKPYAQQFQEPVEDKINTLLQKQVDDALEEASGRIVKFGDDKIDAVMAKITGPINDKIDAKAKEAVEFAHKKIDDGKALALKKLDEKKAQLSAKLKAKCDKKPAQAAQPAAAFEIACKFNWNPNQHGKSGGELEYVEVSNPQKLRLQNDFACMEGGKFEALGYSQDRQRHSVSRGSAARSCRCRVWEYGKPNNRVERDVTLPAAQK